MKAYFEDLRKKIVGALLRGTRKSEAARLFGVSLSSVKSYARTAREGRPLTPKKNLASFRSLVRALECSWRLTLKSGQRLHYPKPKVPLGGYGRTGKQFDRFPVN